MKISIDSTTERIQSTDGMALAGKILENNGLSDISSDQGLKHPQVLEY
ncbi:hypothetical protein [Spirochaeta isovalerica]|uniref:Uncharacterized protein n=1 Tax=Spirochaeta isovalerica TaxID=150 RepID=A0A841R7N0_9SPIO|nr:hypothetical protein [Spirochaeta isovalerica]MBB6479865.1 hypothetical protein [Spirochaeta isovalerica]